MFLNKKHLVMFSYGTILYLKNIYPVTGEGLQQTFGKLQIRGNLSFFIFLIPMEMNFCWTLKEKKRWGEEKRRQSTY